MKKITVSQLAARKQAGEKVVVLTAYDAAFARLFDEAGVDIMLVGDSLGMVFQGNENTLPVTLDEMIYHCRAVRRGTRRAQLVVDMPFMSYQVSVEQGLASAARLVKEGGAEAVKLEGGRKQAPLVTRLVDAGIPVMGHVGLLPQSVHAMGGFKAQGRTEEAAAEILDDAVALDQAGAYSIVLESIPADLGQKITSTVSSLTIGIGAGPSCNGQVLVCYDMLGMDERFAPSFVKRYEDLSGRIRAAVTQFASEVRQGGFPKP